MSQTCNNKRPPQPNTSGRRSPVLGHSHDYVCLNFCSNLAASMSVRNLGRGVVGCGLQLVCVSGFDLVSKGSSLAVGNSWMARGGCAALIGSSLDHHARKACLLQLTMDHRGVVIAMRRPSQKAWWVARKYLRERVRYSVRDHILLNALQLPKQDVCSRHDDSLGLSVHRLQCGGEP